MKFQILLFVLAAATSVSYGAPDKIVCYYGSWATYRQGLGKFDVEDINPKLCTHIIYSFVGINADGSIRILDDWNEIQKNAIGRFIGLKQINPTVKLMVAIGGWNEGSLTFSNVCNNPATRSAFVKNIVAFTKKYNFDGFDIDWEYPAQRGGASTDKQAYASLIKELRPLFDQEKLILSAAVQALRTYHDTSYDVPAMNKYLDFINIMTYDFHGSYDGVTGQDAPLYASPIDTNRELNVDASIKGWIQDGASPSKLVLGMGVYGRSFTLANPSNNGLGATSTGPGLPGPYTAEPGMISYLEICEKIKNEKWTRIWDNNQMTPYLYKDNQWIGYDDVQSITIKSQYVKDNNLGGAMIWSLEMDDFKNVCGGGAYTILSTINSVIKSTSIGPQTQPQPQPQQPATTIKPQTTVVTSAPTTFNSNVCSTSGYVRDPKDCSVFYSCSMGAKPVPFKCPGGLHFDKNIKACNYIAQVVC